MIAPWYLSYYSSEYWNCHSIDEWAIKQEVELLCRLLEGLPHGSRIFDLGCGLGRHAIGLAKAGFQVVGFDCSAWALQQAQFAAQQDGVSVQWRHVDLMTSKSWSGLTADAAIFIRSFGWGSYAHRRRILRQLRRMMSDEARLIVLEPDTATVLSNVNAQGGTSGSNISVSHRFHPAESILESNLRVAVSGTETDSLTAFERIYWPSELASVIRESGFDVMQLQEVKLASRTSSDSVYCVARRTSCPPESLAVASWRTPLADGFELRYASDETEWLLRDPTQAWDTMLHDARNGPPFSEYPVDDPYGAEQAAEHIGAYFGCSVTPDQVSFGAGVTGLLRSLAELAARGIVLGPALIHPDLESWAQRLGAEICLIDEPGIPELLHQIEQRHPSLVHLDRPNFLGELMNLNDLQAVCDAAAATGGLVAVDESAISCMEPAESAITISAQTCNLIVLRGFTKAYSCGGLRIGYAVASSAVAVSVREAVPPLQCSVPSLRTAINLLKYGDIFENFRIRIRQNKSLMHHLLVSAGFRPISGHRDVPWIVLSDEEGRTPELLGEFQIRGLRPAPLPTGSLQPFIHLSVPMSDERMRQFETIMLKAACELRKRFARLLGREVADGSAARSAESLESMHRRPAGDFTGS